MRTAKPAMPDRESAHPSVTLVWRLGTGVECHAAELEDGRTYVEVRSGEKRQCSGLFHEPLKAAEWAMVAQECFVRHGCWVSGAALA